MPALTFRLRTQPPERLDLSPLIPDRLRGRSLAEIERLDIGTSRIGMKVADVFSVDGGDPDHIVFEGGSSRLDNVAAGMTDGRVVVSGDVGQRFGADAAGGVAVATGSVGPLAASGATGGVIRIMGDAGERAGGAAYGRRFGVAGATLIIEGDAGARVGDRMRRGLILVGGAAGDHAGSRMIAGTIVARSLGDDPGLTMRRGTLLAASHGRLLPTFLSAGLVDLVFLRFLRRKASEHLPDLAAIIKDEALCFSGDQAALGQGEILICS